MVPQSVAYAALAGMPLVTGLYAALLPALVGVIGSMQATEALKLLSGMGSSLQGKLMMFNAQHMEWQTMRTARDLNCSVCSPFRAKP